MKASMRFCRCQLRKIAALQTPARPAMGPKNGRQGGGRDQPEADDHGGDVREELARGQVESRRREAQLDRAAEAGAAQPAVDGGEAAGAAGGGAQGAAAGEAVDEGLALGAARRVRVHARDGECAAQDGAAEGEQGLVVHGSLLSSVLSVSVVGVVPRSARPVIRWPASC